MPQARRRNPRRIMILVARSNPVQYAVDTYALFEIQSKTDSALSFSCRSAEFFETFNSLPYNSLMPLSRRE